MSWDGLAWARDMKAIRNSPGVGCSLGMLRQAPDLPCDGLPEWANTFARRMKDAGVETRIIRSTIEEMEIQRRKKVRDKLPPIPITEFDEHLADLLNKFK